MGNVNATEYPLNTESLAKGSTVLAETIEHAFGEPRGTERFRLKLLQAQRYIERRLAERGLLVTTCIDADNIEILTDEAALEYNTRRFEAETRSRDRCFTRLGSTDRANLSESSKAKLDRKVVELGYRVQADRAAKREVRAFKPVDRSTPSAFPVPASTTPAEESKEGKT